MLFMRNSKQATSTELLKSLGNSFAMKDDKYPKTLDRAVTTITNYKSIGSKPAPQPPAPDQKKTGVANAQQGYRACPRCGTQGCSPKVCPMPFGYDKWPKWQRDKFKEMIEEGNTNAQCQQPDQRDDLEQDQQEPDTSQIETGNVNFGVERPTKKRKTKSKRKALGG